jgi:glycosyltransferase involved in cell wall biosynthesis
MPAIHYSSIKLPDEVREVFGLQVAIADWIKAYLRYGSEEKFTFLINKQKDWDELQTLAASVGVDAERLIALDNRFPRENFPPFDLIFRADPHSASLLWQREAVRQTVAGHAGFAFCGLAHAISGLEVGEVLEQYCLAPSDANDAIVCPSRAAAAAIRAFWDSYGDYLRRRFNAAYTCPVQLPIIPLGVDIARFAAITTDEKRQAQRVALGVGDQDIVLLWVGRLSHAIKAHPLAMFQAAEKAAIETGANVHLVMLGYFTPEDAEPMFRTLAADICRTAKVHFIMRGDARFPDGLWAAGDIFLSLVDNMQESFGLTPIEAMAAGLPRVISDWDGYRDSVTQGEDGFLVPTTQPPAGAGYDIAAQLLSGREMYGGYLAKTALSVAVDQNAAAGFIAQLIRDAGLRRRIGGAGRARAQRVYVWKHIIPAYEALWREQAARRKATVGRAENWPSPLPQTPDPFSMYAAFPTAPLSETDRLAVAATAAEIKLLWSHEINIYGLDLLLPPDEATAIINAIAKAGQTPIAAIFAQFPQYERGRLWRTLGWLLKLGIVRRSEL